MGIFGFLGFILILVLLFVFFILAFLGNIIRSIFGFGRRTPKQYYGEKTASSTGTGDTYSSTQSAQSPEPSNGKKKIFADDEGEYVEFEEVK